MENNADLTLENKKGKTPIDVTRKMDLIKIVEEFVERKQKESGGSSQPHHGKVIKKEEAVPVQAL